MRDDSAPDLFSSPAKSATRHHRRDGTLRRLAPIVAPIAADAGSVIDDIVGLEASKALARAFQDGETSGGLTRAQILERAAWDGDAATLEARFDVMVKLELFQPVLDKRHQERYVLNPAGLTGILMFERARERGGIDEVLLRLSRTRAEVHHQLLTQETLAERLNEYRGVLNVYSDQLGRLVATATLRELIEERFQHDNRVLTEVRQLNDEVTSRFPQLDAQATRLLTAALAYVHRLEDLIGRMLDEGARLQDFSVLSAEDYMTAALGSDERDLAAVFDTVVFDPAMPWVDATSVITAIEKFRPRTHLRVRPPEEDNVDREDPLDRLHRLHLELTTRQQALVEELLDGRNARDVTPAAHGDDWNAVSARLGRLIAADSNPDLAARLRFADALRVETGGTVTYASRVELERKAAEGQPQLYVVDREAESA